MERPKKIKKNKQNDAQHWKAGWNYCCDKQKKYYHYLLSKLPSDAEINKSPCSEYARAYYQGKFNLLMDLMGMGE